jgi:hypothetical protein
MSMHETLGYTLTGASVVGLVVVIGGAIAVLKANKPWVVAVLMSAVILAVMYALGYQIHQIETVRQWLIALPK